MTTHYKRSSGELVEIATMNHAYLATALAKLQREEPERADEIAAMEAKKAELDAEFAALKAPFVEAGFRSREHFDGASKRTFEIWRSTPEGPAIVTAAHKTEGAAWAALFALPGVLT